MFYSLLLHIRYGHRPISLLQAMIDQGHINVAPGQSKKLAPLPGPCPICVMAGATKIPRGPCVDTTELPVGFRWHMDFTFFNTLSKRGFRSCLTAIDATSRMLYLFPCRNKRPPIDITRYLFNILRQMGYPCVTVRVDEGGELARSEEFMLFLKDELHMRAETTGGHDSSSNGKIESPHGSIKKSVCAMLMSANLPDPYRCFTA